MTLSALTEYIEQLGLADQLTNGETIPAACTIALSENIVRPHTDSLNDADNDLSLIFTVPVPIDDLDAAVVLELEKKFGHQKVVMCTLILYSRQCLGLLLFFRDGRINFCDV